MLKRPNGQHMHTLFGPIRYPLGGVGYTKNGQEEG